MAHATMIGIPMADDPQTLRHREEATFWSATYWEAVENHYASMDGVLVYAVLSTGVYCRPSCKAGRPLRENVLFFERREAAEKSGFRPCLRCHPQLETVDPQLELAERVCRYIDSHLDEPVTLSALSRELHVSPFHLQRTFQAAMGITPRAYADAQRIDSLRQSLQEGHSVTRAMYDAGYGSSSRLCERTSSQLGMTPAAYRKRGSGAAIQFAIGESPLGWLLVAGTARGV